MKLYLFQITRSHSFFLKKREVIQKIGLAAVRWGDVASAQGLGEQHCWMRVSGIPGPDLCPLSSAARPWPLLSLLERQNGKQQLFADSRRFSRATCPWLTQSSAPSLPR